MTKAKSTRANRLLAVFGALAIAIGAGTSALAQTNLVFMEGDYESEFVRKQLDIFQQQYPGLVVDYSPEPSGSLRQKAVTILSTKGRHLDVIYVGDEQLGAYADAGWIQPLDDMPGIDGYLKDLSPYTRDGLTYKGKIYGLPYYSDFQIWMVNEEMAKKAEIDHPPVTWDEVRDQALKVKKLGLVDFPISTAMRKEYPGTWFLWWSMVYGAGGHVFDKDNNPLFPDKDPTSLQALEWLVKAVNEWKIIDPAAVEWDGEQSRDVFAAGKAFMGDVYKYELAFLNDPKQAPMAGKLKMVPFPKFAADQPGGSLGWLRAYAITSMSTHKEDAWKLLQFIGGKDGEGQYRMAKAWYVNHGLGFGFTSLLNDPDVVATTQKWVNPDDLLKQSQAVRTRENIREPWFSEWSGFHEARLQEAILGKISAKEALEMSAKKAQELKAEWQ